MSDTGGEEYDDGLIACTRDALVIRRYSALGVMPVITPDDPDRVVAVLRSHGVTVADTPGG